MAPEVLESSQYDAKADIWSLAITAYELAVGHPPHANIHPMRAIFIIPTSPPPTLPEPNDFSDVFKDFLAVCLQKDAKKRPTAYELLKHPFIANSEQESII
uniref:Serine/threonine-protein kinase svkA n=1 Tax=Lygus hesperus TaxID=30085 RepID=A0A0A9XIT0_LYGHE